MEKHQLPEPIDAPVLDRVLALNNAHASETSKLSMDELAHLVDIAAVTARIGNVAAFVIALTEQAAYSSPNFQWFKQRFHRFMYVDRIVVEPSARRRGLARTLYEHTFSSAVRGGRKLITCEVNADPPNSRSDAFHATLGFEPIGAARIEAKRVRYLVKHLDASRKEG